MGWGREGTSGPGVGPALRKESCPSPDHTAPCGPQVSDLHWPRPDGGTISVHAAQGRYVGCSFLGQQVPAGIVAQVACRVSRIQDDGPAIPTQGQSYSWQHLGVPLWDCLNYSASSPNTVQGPGTPPCSRHTLEGRMEKKLHTDPFCFLYPGQTLLINHRVQAGTPSCR